MSARVLLFCLTLATVQAAASADLTTPGIDGSWTGSRNGSTVSWEVGSDGRLRIDGRGADYIVNGDSLFVTFDPADPDAPPETAIYRFAPEAGMSRLFIYGFDLGKQGLLLNRVQRDEPDEDAAAPPPPPGAPGGR